MDHGVSYYDRGGTIQIYAMLQRFFVGILSLGDSAVSVVNFASRLTQFPQSILITAVTTVIYPILSRKEAEDDHQSIKDLYGKGIHYLLLLLGPVTIFSYFYAENLVQVIFEYGKFTADDTAITAPVVAIFVLSMLFLAANTYITRFTTQRRFNGACCFKLTKRICCKYRSNVCNGRKRGRKCHCMGYTDQFNRQYSHAGDLCFSEI